MLARLPNYLTLLRIALIPVFVAFFFVDAPWGNAGAALVFAVASLTDWLDGYLARKYNTVSPFGTFLDPVADKLMVATALVLLTGADRAPGLLTAIIVGREITVSALREWMAEVGQRAKVAVSWIGKGKATSQMLAIVFLLYDFPIFGLPTHSIGLALLFFAAFLTLWSMLAYLRAAWPNLRFAPPESKL
ncbi:MAG: CDP-diacylglycerol--glycerol-3-phosphate 3-phosphatidyltransferase [Pseudomonadota bacterium]|uniref:CDP-diacylglycerol--glycerol-3-phosphate 3-phosphatidyltransferase n=1 Tax=Thermithiobacillus tepidarius TaxID=929 RepID=UPI00040BA88C|nr:CDP-diacylglycerol--glycerol-3-phosphate 3-phosphatidyltransferase [Thermithiobacillus tepidarius]